MKKQESTYRWGVYIAVLFTYGLIVSQRTAPGLITDQLMKEFHLSASFLGILTSIQFFAYAGLQIPIGILSDRYGPNRFLIIGAVLNGLGVLIFSVASNEFLLILARLLAGIGDATIWINLVLILSQWFRVNEFVKLLGFAGMTGGLGFLTATVPFSAWIAVSGWRTPFSTVGLILCLCGAALYIILEKKPKQMFKSEPSPVNKEKKRENVIYLLIRIMKDRQAWATFLCHFGLVGSYVGFIGSWAVPYGMTIYGMSRLESSQLVMVGLIGALVGAPYTGWISSRLNQIKRPYLVVHTMVLLSWTTFVLLDGKPPYILLILLYLMIGFGNGASALTFAVVRKSFSIKDVGVVSGFANTGGFLSAVLLPSFFGKVLDYFHTDYAGGGYHYGFIIPVVFSVFGLIGGILIKEKHEGTQPLSVPASSIKAK
ncbi:MFS transporter [Bacillus sp. JJ1764]|uniref:MFS transporter n=1 Tax=Bacillus sp. JJ1764 TaxID=3122964 RepID=UPI002FFECF10